MATFLVISVWLVFVVGWISNIVQIVGMISEPITVLLLIKGLGVLVAPMGAFLGWVGIF